MDLAIEQVIATTVEPRREEPEIEAPAAPRVDPEAILALLRREQSRVQRLKAD